MTKNINQEIDLGGKLIKLRSFEESDTDQPEKFLTFINTLIEDPEAMISRKYKIHMETEEAWLQKTWQDELNGKSYHLLAEYNNQLIGLCGLMLGKDRMEHVAKFVISILNGFRGIGLGSLLTKTVIDNSCVKLNPPPVNIRLSVFANNFRAIKLYEQFGFTKVAQVPDQLEFFGEMVDEIIMVKK